MRGILGHVGPERSGLVLADQAIRGGEVRRLQVGQRAFVAGRLHVAHENAATVVADDGGMILRAIAAGELRIGEQQLSICAHRRHRVVARDTSDADGLTFIRETRLPLSAQSDVLKRLAVHRPRRRDAARKPDDLAIRYEQRPVHIAMPEVQPYRAAALRGDEAAVAHRAGVVRVELQRHRGRVVRADIERQVLDVIVKPIRAP
jgi:hypothetical protein